EGGGDVARLWVRDESGDWALLPLDPSTSFYTLSTNPPRSLDIPRESGLTACGTVLTSGDSGGPATWLGEEVWLLLSARRAGVLVNGLPLLAGIRLLDDRDEIRVSGSGTYYFSSERAVRPETFRSDPDASGFVRCPRCLRGIREGDLYVRCPRCGVLHHHLPEDGYPCWTYTDRCAVCGRSTALTDEPEWSPDEI
ncbi:MAG: hypothetical protein ABIH26_15120, partial [Candidatus Eisenbacteria bacterium]